MIFDKDSAQGEDFAAQYRALSDAAITQLAIEGGLRPEADVALRAEMRKRSIGTKEVRSFGLSRRRRSYKRGSVIIHISVIEELGYAFGAVSS